MNTRLPSLGRPGWCKPHFSPSGSPVLLPRPPALAPFERCPIPVWGGLTRTALHGRCEGFCHGCFPPVVTQTVLSDHGPIL